MTRALFAWLLFAAAAAGQPPAAIDPARPVNWGHALNRGLCVWMLALPNQNRGVIFRDVAKRNHGTLTNMSPAEDWKSAGRRTGWALLDLDGTNDHVSAAVNPSIPTAYPLTVSCIVNRRTSGAFMSLAMYGRAEAGGVGWGLELDEDGNIEWNNTVAGATSTGAISDGVPYLVCITNASATSHRYYAVNLATGAVAIDETKTDNLTINVNSTWPLLVGTYETIASGKVDYLDGLVDDVRLWNRVLSSAELRALARDAAAGYPETLAWVDRPFHAPEEPAGGGSGGAAYYYRMLMGALLKY